MKKSSSGPLRRLGRVALIAAIPAALLPVPTWGQVPEGSMTDLPVLSAEVPRGTGEARPIEGPTPAAKVADGDISDWVGLPSRFGGTAVYSAGELVYQDHLFDAHGPDDGRDSARLQTTGPLEEVIPEAYRIDALAQSDPSSQVGAQPPDQLATDDTYGDAVSHQDGADLAEVRVALSGDELALLARTTTMTGPPDTALLVLADTQPNSTSREVPFNSGITTSAGDVALFIADGTVLAADLEAATVSPLQGATVAAGPQDWDNALEATLALSAISGSDGAISIAVASGKPNESGDGFAHLAIETADDEPHAHLANVAFRLEEPVRVWFERDQALALHARSIDPFFYELDLAAMSAGASQEYVPAPGYHDRIFLSDPETGVPRERGRDGIFQHYGVYLPTAYDGDPVPLQWWLHWRGGTAHSGAAIVPRVFKQFGEDNGTLVVAPSGRGTSTWYVGRGHVDVLEVWADVFGSFAIDDDRVYVTGHSMGGWGSYLLTLLYPDRFAAAAPVAGPVTQGLWTGLDFPGCNSLPCYSGTNDGRARDQHTRKLLENSRHVPYAILQGTSDELVWYSGVFRQAERLVELGYRHRLYTYPGYEHFSHPIADQWSEAAGYLQSFIAPENPARVTYKRDMPFEIATEQVQSGGATLNFDFDSAYWMSGLTPVDMATGTASFDGRSLAIPEEPFVVAPDTGLPTAPGQTGPYVITGLQWIDDPRASAPEPVNAFDVNLAGASTVRLDLERMSIDTGQTVAGVVTTEHALELGLDGGWATTPEVLLDGEPVAAQLQDGVLTVTIPVGSHGLSISAAAEPEEAPTIVEFTDGSDTSAQYSDAATLQARLTNLDGAPLVGETLTFSLGTQSASATTDFDGVATVQIPVTDAPGESSASATFSGRTGELAPAIASVPFTIEHEDTAITLDVSGRGSKRTLTATLVDADSGAPIAGRTVVFSADGQELGTAITDESGAATFKPPARHRGNKHEFTATFAGDDFFLASSDTENV